MSRLGHRSYTKSTFATADQESSTACLNHCSWVDVTQLVKQTSTRWLSHRVIPPSMSASAFDTKGSEVRSPLSAAAQPVKQPNAAAKLNPSTLDLMMFMA